MTRDSSCPKCRQPTMQMNKLIIGTEMYVCFSCMQLAYPAKVTDWEALIPMHLLVRRKANDWKIGVNRQTTKNQLWEEELELLFSIWISKKTLE